MPKILPQSLLLLVSKNLLKLLLSLIPLIFVFLANFFIALHLMDTIRVYLHYPLDPYSQLLIPVSIVLYILAIASFIILASKGVSTQGWFITLVIFSLLSLVVLIAIASPYLDFLILSVMFKRGGACEILLAGPNSPENLKKIAEFCALAKQF